jgi:hypothetical protein
VRGALGNWRPYRDQKMRADVQKPDRRPTVADERANDCEAHIHHAHWW